MSFYNSINGMSEIENISIDINDKTSANTICNVVNDSKQTYNNDNKENLSMESTSPSKSINPTTDLIIHTDSDSPSKSINPITEKTINVSVSTSPSMMHTPTNVNDTCDGKRHSLRSTSKSPMIVTPLKHSGSVSISSLKMPSVDSTLKVDQTKSRVLDGSLTPTTPQQDANKTLFNISQQQLSELKQKNSFLNKSSTLINSQMKTDYS